MDVAAQAGGNGTVNAPFNTITQGINAASFGEIIEVSPGTYNESINFFGKTVVLRSSGGAAVTAIQAPALMSCVVFVNGESSSCVLEGFTLTGGSSTNGAGIDCSNGSPRIQSCIIRANTATSRGGGAYIGSNMSPIFVNCAFLENTTNAEGAAVYVGVGAAPKFVNCTLTNNTSVGAVGGAMYLSFNAAPDITNSIIWGNTPDEVAQASSAAPVYAYCNILGGAAGVAIINMDPQFESPVGGNFHIRCNSPCLEAGTSSVLYFPTTDVDGDPRIVGGAPDIGADEYTSTASTGTWYVSTNGPNPGCGTASSPFTNIQATITAAVPGDTIIVAPGVYNEAIDFMGKPITLLAAQGVALTTIDAGSQNRAVSFVSGEGPGSVIDGFTLQGGYTVAAGGGVLCSASSPTIRNCRITASTAAVLGGGIACVVTSNPTLTNCTIDGNTAQSAGAVYCDGTSSVTLDNCTIDANSATNDGGGIAVNGPSGVANINGCDITNNNAGGNGGGIWLMPTSTVNVSGGQINQNTCTGHGGGIHVGGATCAVTSCTMDGNLAGLSGGGIYVGQTSDLTVTSCTISNGTGVVEGGGLLYESPATAQILSTTFDANKTLFGSGAGMLCRGNGPLSIDGCTFKNNVCQGTVAAHGGGIAAEQGSTVDLSNTLFQNNTVNGDGGGLWIATSTPNAVDGCTFEGNSATNGGGIAAVFASNPTITNCVVDSNSAQSGGGVFCDWNSVLTMNDCAIEANTANVDGAGVVVSGPSTVNLNACTISGNAAISHGGGVAVNGPAGAATLNGCVVNSNTSGGNGGGVAVMPAATGLTVERSQVILNSAVDGGGIHAAQAPLTLNGATVAANIASGNGGGVNVAGTQMTVDSCTFSQNAGGNGGGVYADGLSTVTGMNSIFWADGSSELSGPGLYTIDYCNVQGGYPGTGNISVDPAFVDPAAMDFHLLPNSPCRDTGSAPPSMLTTDIDGDARPSGACPDMGCDEAVYLRISQPGGADTLRIEVAHGPAGNTYFSAFTMHTANAGPGFGTGWWGGLHIPFNDLLGLYSTGAPPFVGTLSPNGDSVFSWGPSPVINSFSGQTWYALTYFFSSANTPWVHSDVVAYTFL